MCENGAPRRILGHGGGGVKVAGCLRNRHIEEPCDVCPPPSTCIMNTVLFLIHFFTTLFEHRITMILGILGTAVSYLKRVIADFPPPRPESSQVGPVVDRAALGQLSSSTSITSATHTFH
jgi:hypothetical protein